MHSRDGPLASLERYRRAHTHFCEREHMVEEGKPAPDFQLETDAGETVSLKDFRGKPVILYFYPKDDSPTTI